MEETIGVVLSAIGIWLLWILVMLWNTEEKLKKEKKNGNIETC